MDMMLKEKKSHQKLLTPTIALRSLPGPYMMEQVTAWMTDYADDVLVWMRKREQTHLPYYGNSPQLSDRGNLIDFLCKVTESLKLSVVTTHLAVYLLDRFMDAHHINQSQLLLTALTAILLAAKFEEKDLNIPRIPELNSYTRNKYSISIFNSMELFMLKFFNWNIGTVTGAHFVELYMTRGVTVGDTYGKHKTNSLPHIRRDLWITTSHFMDISLRDPSFLQWSSSEVAAACMACGRLIANLYPVWTPVLQTFTGYNLESLSQIVDLLISRQITSRYEDLDY